MLVGTPCELEEGELSPPAATARAATAAAAIPAADAASEDFFDAVTAHQMEQNQKDANNAIVVPASPLSAASGARTPGVVLKVDDINQEAEGPHGVSAPSQGPGGDSCPRPLALEGFFPPRGNSAPDGDPSRKLSAAEGDGAFLGPQHPLSERGASQGGPNGAVFPIERPEDMPSARGPPTSVRYLLSPADSIVGMLREQEEDQDQSKRKTALLPLNLQKAHQVTSIAF